MTTIAQLGVDLTANSAKFVSELGKAQAALNSHAAQMNSSLRGIKSGFDSVLSAAASFGAAIGTGAIVALAKQSLEAAANVRVFAQQVGVSTDVLQEYEFAAKQSGVGSDQMRLAMMRLTASIGGAEQGSKAQIDALNKMGVSILGAQGHFVGFESVVRQIADAYVNAGDKAQFAAGMKRLMGREAQLLIPIFAEGSAGLDRFAAAAKASGQVLSQDMIEQAKKANDAITAMESAIAKLAQTIMAMIAPAITNGVRGLFALFNIGLNEADQLSILETRYRTATAALAMFLDQAQRFESGGRIPLALSQQIARAQAQVDSLGAQIDALRKGQSGAVAGTGTSAGSAGLPTHNPLSTEDIAKAQAIQKVIDGLKLQVDFEARRAAADQADSRALENLNDAYEIGQALQANKISLSSREGQEIAALIVKRNEEKRAVDASKKGYDDFLAALDKNAAAIRQANQQIDDMIASIEQQSEQNTIEANTAGLTAGQIAALNGQRKIENQLLKDHNVLSPERSARLQADLKTLQETTDALARQKAMDGELANFATSAFDRIGQAIDNAILQKGGAAFNDFKNVALSVIQEIENEFIKLAVINPIKNALGIGGGNLPDLGSLLGNLFRSGSGSGLTASSLLDVQLGSFPFHSGGIVGGGSPSRLVPAVAFASAPRFHSGGFIGAGEVPVIARKGEGIFTPEQMAAMGGDTFVINNNFALGVQGTVRAEVMQMMPQIAKSVIAATQDKRSRGKVRSLA